MKLRKDWIDLLCHAIFDLHDRTRNHLLCPACGHTTLHQRHESRWGREGGVSTGFEMRCDDCGEGFRFWHNNPLSEEPTRVISFRRLGR